MPLGSLKDIVNTYYEKLSNTQPPDVLMERRISMQGGPVSIEYKKKPEVFSSFY